MNIRVGMGARRASIKRRLASDPGGSRYPFLRDYGYSMRMSYYMQL